jgi:hypothetical protein
MAFYLHDKPKKTIFEDLYDLRKCALGGDIEMSMVLENTGGNFTSLDDGGFFLRGFSILNSHDGFIIRFDKDLKTKSNLINKKVFLIDRDVFVKKFLKKHISESRNRAEDYQALHDDLLKYFMEIKNKEQK